MISQSRPRNRGERAIAEKTDAGSEEKGDGQDGSHEKTMADIPRAIQSRRGSAHLNSRTASAFSQKLLSSENGHRQGGTTSDHPGGLVARTGFEPVISALRGQRYEQFRDV